MHRPRTSRELLHFFQTPSWLRRSLPRKVSCPIVGTGIAHLYQIQNIIRGGRVARLHFNLDSQLNVTVDIKDILQLAWSQGHCETASIINVAISKGDATSVLMEWIVS